MGPLGSSHAGPSPWVLCSALLSYHKLRSLCKTSVLFLRGPASVRRPRSWVLLCNPFVTIQRTDNMLVKTGKHGSQKTPSYRMIVTCPKEFGSMTCLQASHDPLDYVHKLVWHKAISAIFLFFFFFPTQDISFLSGS